ncbi:uncharacterized protein [Diadema setosum]|uniref:uncharacterized protein n=1 Tax=Diadema setosum TaxID=31175 RepID=UPI003B3B9D9B
MTKIELTVSSLIGLLMAVQLVVSVTVIGTIMYMNSVGVYMGQMNRVRSAFDELGSRKLSGVATSKTDKETGAADNSTELRLSEEQDEKIKVFEKTVQENLGNQMQFRDSNTDSVLRGPRSKNFVILTSVNAEFVDIAENWLESLRRLGLRYNITLVAEDSDTYKYFSIRANKEFRVLYQKQYAFNFTRRFGPVMMYQELIRRRTVYIRTLLEQGQDVLLVDADTIWVKDPVAFIMSEYGIYDLWFAQGFENHIPCPCFMYMRSTPRVVAMVKEWVWRLENHRGRRMESDQVALAHILPRFEDIPFKRLDFDQFPTGKHLFNPEWLEEHWQSIYVAHCNHAGRHDAKKQRLQEIGLWLLNS